MLKINFWYQFFILPTETLHNVQFLLQFVAFDVTFYNRKTNLLDSFIFKSGNKNITKR